MDDIVVGTLGKLGLPGVQRGEVQRREPGRRDRSLRWVEAGSGSPAVVFDAGLGEPGSLAWAGVLPAVAARTRVIAYDRAGVGASDPVVPSNADSEIGDLSALLGEAGDGPCVLVGHSWGGLLVQLVAFRRPDLVAGLVLVDPADEETLAALPWPLRLGQAALGHAALLLRSLGLLGRVIRKAYRPFAGRLTEDPELQAVVLDAYASCFSQRSQVRMLRDENQLSIKAIPVIRQLRAGSGLSGVPVIVLSATKGLPKAVRDRWTKAQGELIQKAAWGDHIIAQDTGHAIHQERPEQVADAVIRVVEFIRSR